MSFEIPPGHYLVCYDYGMGGLWWYLKADSPAEIRKATPDLIVYEEVPGWMLGQDWKPIECDDLKHPRSKALRMILAGKK